MKKLKTFEEYRYFKVDRDPENVKDPNEPFFLEPKFSYKTKKRIFGDGFKEYSDSDVIKIDVQVIDNLLNSENLSEKLVKILNKIKKYAIQYKKWLEYVEKNGDDENTDDYCPDTELTFKVSEDDDIRKLMQFGFDVKIYDDSNEFSEDFSDKCRVMWDWK